MPRSIAAVGLLSNANRVAIGKEVVVISRESGGILREATRLALAGREFRVLGRAGTGATSSVWRVADPDGCSWALKAGHSQAQALGLAREAERLLGIGSPFLAQVVDAGRLNENVTLPSGKAGPVILPAGAPYLLMQWCEGDPLDVLAVPESERAAAGLAILGDLALALSDLHSAGISHGDIKPSNILVQVGPEGVQARLVDLGMGDTANRVVPLGGTVRYLAPEVFDPALRGDGRARDLYALALSLAEWWNPALAGQENLRQAALLHAWSPELAAFLLPLLHEWPAARPSAAWIVRSVSAVTGRVPGATWQQERRRLAVKRSYLAVRRTDWERAARHAAVTLTVAGEPGRWLSETVALARKLMLLQRENLDPTPVPVSELDGVRRVRWLTQLVGVSAAHWPAPEVESDHELAARLSQAVEHVSPECLTLRQLTSGRSEGESVAENAIDIALQLAAPGPSAAVVDAAERLIAAGAGSAKLALALARTLRLRGELGRAVVVLERLGTAEAALELAELWRRMGDKERALQVLCELPSGKLSMEQLSRTAALRARIALDQGDVVGCLEMLAQCPESAPLLETRALAQLRGRKLDAAQRSLERALVYASSDEERARVLGAEGMLHHARADAERAEQRFGAAAEHAGRAGAVLEEATYLTGVAAAATDRGRFGVALQAAERATLLFESLGRSRDAARASLARAAVFSSLGLVLETEQAVEETRSRARAASDGICLGYAHLALADALPHSSTVGRDHAERAAQLLSDGAAADRTRAAARCLEKGLSVDLVTFDALARSQDVSSDVRLEWWGARAERAEHEPDAQVSGRILLELEALAGERTSCLVKGRTLAAGARLALAIGNTDVARRLAAGAAEAARELRSHAPAELATAIEALPWVELAQGTALNGLLPEQLSDVERLVRALGRRDGLRPLLDQVLDALVLWTGVERGLLLLCAPGNRLVPRAARNLIRADLTGEQLELSYSLAKSALARREPVVAVDAAGELPEMHASVHALKLRSVLAVPLLARGEAFGVVYLDDRERRGAFGVRELAWVKLVATLAAVAIADVRDQLLLRRAARRAERAEAKLTETLRRREVELEVAERELAKTRGPRETRYAYEAIIGDSPALCNMLKLVDRVTATDVPLLLMGESGVGKELIARAIHDNGPRGAAAFVAENCAAIPEGLLESTLFGHVRGAFTGAQRPRAGLFEAASGGSLFLDEIAEMPLGMQSKLLRVLQDGEVRPVGAEQARKVNVRVMAATHRDLQQMVKEGRFREDLLYRLNVISIMIPPLRERGGDIERLIEHFMRAYAPGRQVSVASDAMSLLCSYAWPGNIRQLENEVRRFLVVADGRVERSHLSAELRGQPERVVFEGLGLNVRRHVDALEAELVKAALDKTGGNQTRAAQLLGLSRFGLQKMMKRLEIAPRRAALRRVTSGLSDAE